MSKLVTALFLAALLPGAARAAKAPDVVTYEATRAGTVQFPHKLLAARGCKQCHPASPAKIGPFERDSAHAFCKACHENLVKGPTKCDGCHKR